MAPVNGDRRAEVLALLHREDDPGLSLYRAFFESHAAAMILLDPRTGTLVDANAAACALYGFSRDEMRRGSVWDVTVAPLEGGRLGPGTSPSSWMATGAGQRNASCRALPATSRVSNWFAKWCGPALSAASST